MKMPPTGAETLQAAKERKSYGYSTRKDGICQMENGSALFPMCKFVNDVLQIREGL